LHFSIATLVEIYCHEAMTTSNDSSTRYVLPEDAPYLANLAALWVNEPALAAKIEALPEPGGYPTELSKSGPPTVSLSLPDSRRLYLHSRFDPAAEGAKLIESIETADKAAYFILGFALGYHVEALFDRAGDEAIFCIFESDLRLLRTAMESRDLSRLLESRRLMFFTSLDKAELLNRLNPHTALLSLGTETIVHAASQQMNGTFYDQVTIWLEEYASYRTTSMNTLVLNSRRTAENIARNIGWYAASPSLERLRNCHRGDPAVIVSAGPSLRKNRHLLKDLQGRAVIIAVQTTLQPLLEMGIEPHFVTSLDYHEICTRFFEKLPPTLKTELIAEPKANNAIFKMNPGPLSVLGNDFAEGLLREMNLKHAVLQPGATVAHLAYYLAEHIACDPIIFVGQDLGFSDGLCYAPGTSYEDVWAPELSRFCSVEMKQWEQIVRERFILRKIPDYQGRPMYTEERLFSYLQQFERDFLKTRTRIIDATEGGAAKAGSTPMPLADARDRFCRNPLTGSAPPHPGLDWSRKSGCTASLQNRKDEAATIERVSKQTLPLLREIRDHLDSQPRVNRAIAAIDTLRAKMNEFGRCYDLITQLTQPTELTRFRADRKIASSRVSGIERQKLQVERDIDNVRGIMQAARDFQDLMDEVIASLASSLKEAA
jgi:hypothetical protein